MRPQYRPIGFRDLIWDVLRLKLTGRIYSEVAGWGRLHGRSRSGLYYAEPEEFLHFIPKQYGAFDHPQLLGEPIRWRVYSESLVGIAYAYRLEATRLDDTVQRTRFRFMVPNEEVNKWWSRWRAQVPRKSESPSLVTVFLEYLRDAGEPDKPTARFDYSVSRASLRDSSRY